MASGGCVVVTGGAVGSGEYVGAGGMLADPLLMPTGCPKAP